MKRHFLFALVAAVAVACGQPILEETRTGDIAGVVYDKNVGDPISVAQVQLTPGGASTVTGTDGSFAFNNIETGSYTVTVSKKGYNDVSNKVTVLAGKKADCQLLMERIPAYVTADKTELDFGDNLTLTTLSFNIVNSSYENLSWHIEYDKSSSSFIAEVSPESGTTQYGKTSVIIVKIDRTKLNVGSNESTIVVVSDNGEGSSEVKVKVIGQEKRMATLNMAETTDIKSTSAVLHAEITDKGIPEYTERGFVIGESEMPTRETALKEIRATVTQQNVFSEKVDELGMRKTYYARAYAINDQGVAYSTNQSKFTTIAVLPSVSILASTEIKSSSAILNAQITDKGTPEYTERGFVIGDSEMPTKETAIKVLTVTIDAHDKYSMRIGELKLGQTYYVRAFAENAVGVAYSTTMDQFTTIATLPNVTTLAATDEDRETRIVILHGNISFEGDPAYTERGFVWSLEYENPTIEDSKIIVAGSGIGDYQKRLAFPSSKRTIYIRAYATNQRGTAYGETVEVFPLEYIQLTSDGLGVQKNDINGESGLIWSDGDSACKNSRVGAESDWRLPTKDELYQLFFIKESIGGFNTMTYNGYTNLSRYWTSTIYPEVDGRRYYVDFSNGTIGYAFIGNTGWPEFNSNRYSVRCVRTLTLE